LKENYLIIKLANCAIENKDMEIKIKVICEELPGTEFSTTGELLIYKNIHLGIQRGEEVINAVPANRKQVVFEPEFRVAPLPDGKTNFLGPYAKGTQTERFFYLSWVVKNEQGNLTSFRRAKIHLSHLLWSKVEEAINSGRQLSVTLSMTDKKGGPRCASFKGEGIHWQI
jgi:hypothetical protein